MATSRFFELDDHIGIEPDYTTGPDGEPVENPKAGELQPAGNWGLVIGTETVVLVEDEFEKVQDVYRVDLHPIPGTRIYETDNPEVAMALAQHAGVCHEVDPPAKAQPKQAAKKPKDASGENAPNQTPGSGSKE